MPALFSPDCQCNPQVIVKHFLIKQLLYTQHCWALQTWFKQVFSYVSLLSSYGKLLPSLQVLAEMSPPQRDPIPLVVTTVLFEYFMNCPASPGSRPHVWNTMEQMVLPFLYPHVVPGTQ